MKDMFRVAFFLAVAIASSFGATARDGVQQALSKAEALASSHRVVEAKAAFAGVLRLSPDNAEANYRLGIFACNSGEWEKALAYESKAVAQDPRNAKYQYGWGAANGLSAMKSGIFSKIGYARKCAAAYKRAVELEPTNTTYHYAAFNYYLQAPRFVGGDMDLALSEAKRIKELDPGLGRQAFAQYYLATKQPDRAFKEYEGALREKPDDYSANYRFAMVALASNQRIDDGIAALRRCLALGAPQGQPSHANVHWQIGNLYEKEADPESARVEFEAALKEDPKFGPAKAAIANLSALRR